VGCRSPVCRADGIPVSPCHGLGTPVKNATTTVNLPSEGKYHIWARTRNWAKGDWEAPGRFRLCINGEELEEVLGTGDETWQWQYAGSKTIKGLKAVIELKDLTGFEGRCDAVYLNTGKNDPPDTSSELALWRGDFSEKPKYLSDQRSLTLLWQEGGLLDALLQSPLQNRA